MNNTQHTPTPWTSSIGMNGGNIYPDDTHSSPLTMSFQWARPGELTTDVHREYERNVAHIVHCVNNFEALVEALEEAFKQLCEDYAETPEESRFDKVRTALAAAKKGIPA